MDEEGLFGCLATITIFGVLIYCFPIIMTSIICLIIIIGVLVTYLDSKGKRKEFLIDLQSDIPKRLRITKEEVMYDFGEKGVSTWKYEDFRIFTSRGEFLVKIKDVDNKDVVLVQVSDFDFIKESKK